MYIELDVVMHACNFSTWEAEARASSSRLSWATQLLLILEVIIMIIDNLLKKWKAWTIHFLKWTASGRSENWGLVLWALISFFASIHQLQRSAWPGIWSFHHGIIYPGHEGAIDDHLGDTLIDNQVILFIMVKGRTAACNSYPLLKVQLHSAHWGGVTTLKHLFSLMVLLWFPSPLHLSWCHLI